MLGQKPLSVWIAPQCILPLGKPFVYIKLLRDEPEERLICNQSPSVYISAVSFRVSVWAEWITNGFDADISCCKPVNVSCMQGWGMRFGRWDYREIGGLDWLWSSQIIHRVRWRFSFAIIFYSRPFHSKLDFGKQTQKSDRKPMWELNWQAGGNLIYPRFRPLYMWDSCFTA